MSGRSPSPNAASAQGDLPGSGANIPAQLIALGRAVLRRLTLLSASLALGWLLTSALTCGAFLVIASSTLGEGVAFLLAPFLLAAAVSERELPHPA